MKHLLILITFVCVFGCDSPNGDTVATTRVSTEDTTYKITIIDQNAHTNLITNTKTGQAWTVGPDGINHPVEATPSGR